MKQSTMGLMGLGLVCAQAFAAVPARIPALAETATLEILEIPAVRSDKASGLSYVELRPEQASALGNYMHSKNRCGGFQVLPEPILSQAAFDSELKPLNEAEAARVLMASRLTRFSSAPLAARPELRAAFEQVSGENQKRWVDYLSSFETRYHNNADPNIHVRAVQAKLEELAKNSKLPISIELVSHTRTQQKSIRARILGSKRPTEIVVLGGHLDSTVGWFSRGRAPGSDDNASGSANILESFRILSQMSQPERTIEFYWYAAEEVGLVGSAEIARLAKEARKDVIGALQLDMTLFPGDGPFTLASMEDFTSPWLRQLLVELNTTYALGAQILADKCGYGCSDHASWYQQGYPTLMPFEASFDKMNHEIHTVRDVVTSASNFDHSALFTKIALAFAWELANSEVREPKP
jgi:bacterial leucyl aminopeptidase